MLNKIATVLFLSLMLVGLLWSIVSADDNTAMTAEFLGLVNTDHYGQIAYNVTLERDNGTIFTSWVTFLYAPKNAPCGDSDTPNCLYDWNQSPNVDFWTPANQCEDCQLTEIEAERLTYFASDLLLSVQTGTFDGSNFGTVTGLGQLSMTHDFMFGNGTIFLPVGMNK